MTLWNAFVRKLDYIPDFLQLQALDPFTVLSVM